MPSFFESLKRMVQGKPVFTPDDQNRGWKGPGGEPVAGPPQQQPAAPVQQPTNPAQPPVTSMDYRPPEVSVEEAKCHINGTHLDIYGMVRNHSQEMVFLDKIHFLGMTRELDHQLRPGEKREIRLYEGNVLKNTAYNKAELYYRSETNKEYFAAEHLVEFRTQSDGSIIVHRLIMEHPVRHTT